MDPKQLQFVNDIVGIETKLEERAKKQGERHSAVSQALRSVDARKEDIRAGMQEVYAVDKSGKKQEGLFSEKGQEYALDTHHATKKGHSLTKEDMAKVGEAMRPLVEAVTALRDARGTDGEPLYVLPDDEEELVEMLTQEVFTPLVREGVLPENFVTDKHSEVFKLIHSALASYKEENSSLRDERERERGKAQALYDGAGTGTEQVSARLKALSKLPDKAMDKIGMDAQKRRYAQIGIQFVKTGYAIGSAAMTLESWQVDPKTGQPKIESTFDQELHPEKAGFYDSDPDEARSKLIEAKRAVKIHKYLGKIGLSETDQQRVIDVLNIQENSDVSASKDGIEGYGGALKTIIKDLGLGGYKLDGLRKAVDEVHHEGANVEAAMKCAREIDTELATRIESLVGPGAAKAVKNAYAAAVDVEAVAEAAGELKADDQTIIAEFGIALKKVIASGMGADLKSVGEAAARSFVGHADGKALQDAIAKNPKTAYAPLVKAAADALTESLSGIDTTKKGEIADGLLQASFGSLSRQFDALVVTALNEEVDEAAGEGFSGLLTAQLKADALVKAFRTKPTGDGEAVVEHIAEAFVAAFAHAAPTPTDVAFLDTGKELDRAFRAEADAKAFEGAVGSDMVGAMVALLAAGKRAIESGIKARKGPLKAALSTPEAKRALASKSVYPDGGDEALEELKASEKEMEEYERQLVLIDEGGAAAADLRSIEKLIAQIERDRAICQMVLSVGSVLTALGTSTTSIVGAVTVQVTDTLVGEIVGPLKAAKLIMKFAVAMKAANDRRILLQKFKKSLKLSKKAVSPLQSTIQGFFDNKVEQVTFRAIEDALTLVQIAAAILGSVPEPITLAVGKTMGAIATAAEGTAKVTEMIYNEAMLSAGWEATVGAIRSPGDRTLGLRALRLNPTLGMHAIAWAAMEKKPADAIARNLLDELGLNEQTLQSSGTAAKVRKYLLTVLHEDRELMDPDKIAPKWIPKPLNFDVEGWSVAVNRAWSVAEPKLKASSERTVLVQLKLVLKRDPDGLAGRAKTGAIEVEEMNAIRTEIDELKRLLRNYAPVTADGSRHDEMGNVAANFLKMCAEFESGVEETLAANLLVQMHDAPRVVKRLGVVDGLLDQALVDDTEDALHTAFDEAAAVLREVQQAQLDEDRVVKPPYDQLMTKAGQVSTALEKFD